jgi:hypothetical protein
VELQSAKELKSNTFLIIIASSQSINSAAQQITTASFVIFNSLQKIDELYNLRLDQYISLPQVSLNWVYISANANEEYDSLLLWAINQAVKVQYSKA